MPIYDFACSKCRKIFSFFSQRINPDRIPVCPKCGNKKLTKQVTRFAMIKGAAEPKDDGDGMPQDGDMPMPDFDDPRVQKAMSRMEREMDQMDENNPRHMAHMMRRMQEIMPPGSMPKEMETAIRRLEKGEDPEKIEEDMGDILGDFFGEGGPEGGMGGGGYSHDEGLYDY